MNTLHQEWKSRRQVANWLLTGVIMIVVQVLLGGITRLTESGLSITEWKPITGTLPPLNDAAWQTEFDKYKVTDQFKFVHKQFTLSDFKYIFFWEWFHRVWARLMGMVFLVGFIYFLVKKKFDRSMVMPMVVLFLLGAMQGAIGWIMVKSGLVPEKYYVGHVELATHFIAALGLLCYTLWFSMKLRIQPAQLVVNSAGRRLLLLLLLILLIQLIYGAFMAGMKAAITAPTWPDINGHGIPPTLFEQVPILSNLVNNPITVHFVHRGLAYGILIITFLWWYRTRSVTGKTIFNRLRSALLLITCSQVLLGILTVINATYPNRLLWLGVAHQFTAMVLVMTVTGLVFIVRDRQSAVKS
jgi:cytochrome c oxidase assembly protein subunit 15